MFNVGGGEVLVILLLALIVLGPDKLPNAAKQAGKYLGDFRRMSQGFQDEIKQAMDLEGLTSTKPRRPEPTTKPSNNPMEEQSPSSESAPAVELDVPLTPSDLPAAGSASPAVDAVPADKPAIIVEGPHGSFS